MNFEDSIPGLAEARAWEASVRARAFLDVPYTLGGVEVMPLSLYRVAVLDAARSPLLRGGFISPEAVTLFLWVLSPSFRAGDLAARAAFIAQVRLSAALADLAGCVREIGEYLDEMFLDAPSGRDDGRGSAPVTSNEAVYVELFAEACGWTAHETLNMPLPRLYQVLRRITLRNDPKAIFVNRRSDKVRGDWLRSLQSPSAQGVSL